MKSTRLAIDMLGCGVLAAVAFAPVAQAGTAKLRVSEVDNRSAQFTYRAVPGERNQPLIAFDGSADGSVPTPQDPGDASPPNARAILVQDPVSDGGLAIPGRGCARHSSDWPDWLRCPLSPGAALLPSLISLGDRNDNLSSWGLPGSRIFGGPGHDRIYIRTSPGLRVHGGAGRDNIGVWTVQGDDLGARATLFGGAGADYIGGSDARDLIVPGRGTDWVDGYGGADLIRTADDQLEQIDCGRGNDRLVADGVDWPQDCERIYRRTPSRAIPLGADVYTEDDLAVIYVGCPSDAPGRCIGNASAALGPGASPGGPRKLGRIRLNASRDSLAHLEYEVPILRFPARFPRVRVTVRTRDRLGALQRVTRTLEANVQTPESE